MKGPVIVERVFDAPVERVWKAITDVEQMRQWYFQLEAFRAEPGFTFSFLGGPDDGEKYLHLCTVVEVEPEKRLSCTWRYDGIEGESRVTFELFEEAAGTRLRLTHEGLETFPREHPAFAPESFRAGWEYIIGTSLKAYLENG